MFRNVSSTKSHGLKIQVKKEEAWVGVNQSDGYDNGADDSNASVDEGSDDITAPRMLIAGAIFEHLQSDRYYENFIA